MSTIERALSAVRRRIESAAQAESLGEMMFKGITHPVSVFNVTGLKG